ncbi:MAG: P1 family peptidase [Pseudomonadota bacterium]
MTEGTICPGPRNALTDVAGLTVGQAEDHDRVTGVTVVLSPEGPAMAAAVVGGGGAATRGVSSLTLGGTVERLDGIALSGGSAFGLDAAGGVMDRLRGRGTGFSMGPAKVPMVAGAIIFDLLTGTADDPTGWHTPPWFDLGRAAVDDAGTEITLGNAGAGLGATAGPIKGGTGTASAVAPDGSTVAALAIVNPVGRVTMPNSRAFWAHPWEIAGEYGAVPPPAAPAEDGLTDFPFEAYDTGQNTTLAVVATDLALDRSALARVATMAQDGLGRAIRPVHSPLDGDTVFALATGRRPLDNPLAQTGRTGMLAADCLARAIARGVYAAEGLAGIPAWRDLDDRGQVIAGR